MQDEPTAARARLVVIANAAAGSLSPGLADQVVERCRRHGRTVRLCWTRRTSEVAACLPHPAPGGGSAGPRDVVVALGGDGTVHAVTTALLAADGDTGLLVLPAGTGNSTYRSHWGERAWTEAVDLALVEPDRYLRRLDLARIEESGAAVVLGAGAGLTAEVVDAAPADLRGRERLRVGLERAVRDFTSFPARVTVDGRVCHDGAAVFVNVGGGRYRAWQYDVLPHTRLDDGLLDVCVVAGDVPPSRVPELLRNGAHLREPGTVYARGTEVVIDRTDGRPLSFEHDGEPQRDTGGRVTLRVLPAALPVWCDPAPAPSLVAAAGR